MNGLQMNIKPNPGKWNIRSLPRPFWERLLAPLKETQQKIVPFSLCHCCSWVRGLEQWQPSYAHEDFYLKARLPCLTGLAEEDGQSQVLDVGLESLNEPGSQPVFVFHSV